MVKIQNICQSVFKNHKFVVKSTAKRHAGADLTFESFFLAFYFTGDDATLTYATARLFCIDLGMDLCSYDDICPNGQNVVPIITGALAGDKWAPIR